MKRTYKRFLAWALTLSMACSLCVPVAMAEPAVTSPAPLISTYSPYSDIKGHWAEEAISRWSKYNVVSGFGSEFQPDGVLTRAQMATILSNLLGLTKESAKNPFKDVAGDAWYKTYILRCYEAGVMSGDGMNANPESVVTRQEAMTMLCNALGIAPMSNPDLSAFVDSGSIASWAAPYMAAMVKAGYVGGVGDGKLSPGGEMTRAASMTVLNNAVVQYINAAGTYTLTNEEGIILVASGEVTLTGETKANVLVTPAADGKTVNFDKATIIGSITVQADKAKIVTRDSKLPNVQFTGTGSKVEAETRKKPVGGGGGSSSGGSGGNSSGGNDTVITPTPEEKAFTITEAGEYSNGTYDNVVIAASVGDGEVTLSNVTISGDLVIQGGGSESIKIKHSQIGGTVVVDKDKNAGKEEPRVEFTNTPVAKVEVKGSAIVEAKDDRSVIAEIEAKAPVTVQGTNTKVHKITIPETTAVQEAVAVKIEVGVSVNELEVNAPVEIDAQGNVGEVTAKAKVEVTSGEVERITVPQDAAQPVEIAISASAKVSDVAINTTNEVTLNNEGTVEMLSTELTTELKINKKGNGKTPDTDKVHKHNWGTQWEHYNEDYHAKFCVSDDSSQKHINTKPHNWNKGVVKQDATATEAGLMEYTCNTCGEIKPEIIPIKANSEVQDLITRAQNAGLLDFLTLEKLDGLTRLDAVKLIAGYRDVTIRENLKPDFSDCDGLSESEQTLIAIAVQNGWINGKRDGIFDPKGTITRAEFATLLNSILGQPEVEIKKEFSDVPEDEWFYSAVTNLYNLGIVTEKNGKFEPKELISRLDVLEWLLNAIDWENEQEKFLIAKAEDAGLLKYLDVGNTSNTLTRLDAVKLIAGYRDVTIRENLKPDFSDCDGLSESEQALIAIAVQEGWLNGYQDGTFNPHGKLTRAQCATLLSRILGEPKAVIEKEFSDVPEDEWFYSAVTNLYNLGIVTGVNDRFNPDGMTTKLTALQWLLNAKEWETSKNSVEAVKGFTFEQDHALIVLNLDTPENDQEIDRYRVSFWEESRQRWFDEGSCDGTKPVGNDLPTGHYTKIRVTSVAKNPDTHQDNAIQFPCDLTIISQDEQELDKIIFTELGKNAAGNLGYHVSAYIIGADTEQVVVSLAEESNGDGSRSYMAGNRFHQDAGIREVEIEVYNNKLEHFIPGGYYRVQEVQHLAVDQNNARKAELSLINRGDWEKVILSNADFSVSNIRFDGSYLKWDAPKGMEDVNNLRYRVWLRDGLGQWIRASGTGSSETTLIALPEGNFEGIRIETLYNDESKASVTDDQMTLFISQEPEKAVPGIIEFWSIGEERFEAEVYQVSPDTTCVFRLSMPDGNGGNRGNFRGSRSDDNGRVRFEFRGDEALELLQFGTYTMLEETGISHSTDGKGCKVYFAYRISPDNPGKYNGPFPPASK